MKLISIGVALGFAAAMVTIPSYADDHHKGPKGKHRVDSAMQAVSVGSKAGEPGYGWRYFCDAREARAVVISPGGDYYYSHGDGLKLVFKATAAA